MKFKDIYVNKFQKLLEKGKFILLNRERFNISEILLCPYCLKEKFLFSEDKKEYTCSHCKHSITKKQFKYFAAIQYLGGVLFDFNENDRKSYQRVFDHHGIYKDNIKMTATLRVILFYENLVSLKYDLDEKIEGEDYDLNDLLDKKGLAIIRRAIKLLDLKFSKTEKLNLFTNHIDIDSVLSIFAFRNPIFAMKNRNLLVSLSQFNDLMLFDKKVKDFYLIFYGIETYFREKGKTSVEIFDFFLANLKDIFLHKENYLFYGDSEKQLIQRNLDILHNIDKNDYFKILPGFKNKVLEFRTPPKFHEPIALFEFIGRKENHKFNLPYILKKGVKTEIFSLSVNANVEGFGMVSLSDLEPILHEAERRKIFEIVKKNEEITLKRKEYSKELEKVNYEIKYHKKYNWFCNLRNLIQKDQYEDFYRAIEKSDTGIDYDYTNLKIAYVQLMNCIDELTGGEKRKLSKKEKKQINKGKSQILKELTAVIDELGSGFIDDKKKYENYLNNVNTIKFNIDVERIWVVKPNMVMTNGGYASNLSYEEFVQVLRENLDKVVNV